MTPVSLKIAFSITETSLTSIHST